MLVSQEDWEHIKERCEDPDRCGKPFKWLIEIVTEINQYLPDDWRLTRSANNFRIQIVAEKIVALVGFSYRHNDDEILQIFNTVFGKEYFDTCDVETAQRNKPRQRINQNFKKDNPEIIVPNLYFFRPLPEGFSSPLFARQYEKVKLIDRKKKKYAGDQYHRLHPLTKDGIDMEHHLWVRWTTNGDVEICRPHPAYHGKDYWRIKGLGKSKGTGAFNKHKQLLETLSKNSDVKLPQPVEKKIQAFKSEYKYLVPGTQEDASEAFAIIEEYIRETGLTPIHLPRRSSKHEDIYLDTADKKLAASGASLRIRRNKDTSLLTLKKRIARHQGYSPDGIYNRFEEELMITKEQEDKLLDGEYLPLFPLRLLAYLIPGISKLEPVLTVVTNRKRICLEDEDRKQYELCLDAVTFSINNKPIGPFFEIEIESLGASEEQTQNLGLFLEEHLGLLPSRQTKYERGMSQAKLLKNSDSSEQEKKLVIIDTDCGVDDALALILALNAPELNVMAVTSVSGNVHVDNVLANVFKVFNQLDQDTTALIVARGAAQPLSRELDTAKSVHGEDGLGDIFSESQTINIDKRPSWRVICDLARENPNKITLITLGPLTNLALAIRNDPEGVHCLKEIVSMGGVFFDVGNVAPDAEFNIYTDPDAAAETVRFCRESHLAQYKNICDGNSPRDNATTSQDKIVQANQYKVSLTFVGLDVTHKVLLRKSVLNRIIKAHPEKKILHFIKEISKKYMDFYRENENLPGCYLHDPLAVAYVINPAFLEIEKHIIKVETRGQFTSGVIFPDDRPTKNHELRNLDEAVIGVARNVEKEAFEEFFLHRLIVAL